MPLGSGITFQSEYMQYACMYVVCMHVRRLFWIKTSALFIPFYARLIDIQCVPINKQWPLVISTATFDNTQHN